MTIGEYEAEEERLWDEFMKGMEEYARESDARDWASTYTGHEEVRMLRALVKLDEDLSEKEREEMLKWLDERLRDAEKIEGLASDHRMSMQRHESGSAYHTAYAELLTAIGQ